MVNYGLEPFQVPILRTIRWKGGGAWTWGLIAWGGKKSLAQVQYAYCKQG